MPPDRQSVATSIDSLVREIARVPAVPVHDPIGETFGRYRVTKLIGKGGMGRVYEADDLELGRRVAIKFLPAALAQQKERLTRFVRERIVTADLEHPAIIPIYDSGIWPTNEPFYVMRQVHGEPLDRRLASAANLGERLLLLGNIVAATDAVAFAHSRGVIHRDLKPANLLVGSFGETFVADWGLAKRVHEVDGASEPRAVSGAAESSETGLGSVLGTPAYMAPEQRDGAPVDERADVYALGAILQEMATGARPAAGTDTPRLGMSATSNDLAAIIQKSLARDPADRYGSAGELALELHRLQAGQLVMARRYTRVEIVARWLARRRALVFASAAMAMIVAAVVALSVARIVRERDTAQRERALVDTANHRLTERDEALVLSQARAELTHDPTASLGWLKRYPSTAARWPEAERIAADAVSRGVAARVWELGTPLGSTAFSPDNTTLAVGADDGTLVLLDPATGARRTLRADDGVGARVVFSPDGRHVATSDGVSAVRLWDVSSGTSRRLPGELVGGHHLAFSPDGTRLVVRHPGGFDRMWHVPSGDAADLPEKDALIVFLPGTVDAVVSHEDRLEEVDLGTGRIVASTRIDGTPYDLQPSGDGRWVAASRYDALVLWEPTTGTVHRVPVGRVVVRVISPSPDGRTFATCGLPEESWIFEVSSAAGHLFSTGERCTREGFSFSPDGALFVSTGLGGELRLHDGGATRRLLGEDGSIADAAFSPDGKWLASVGSDGSARLWSLARSEVRVDRGVTPLARIAAGGRLLEGEQDGSVVLVTIGGTSRLPLSGPRPESLRWGTLAANGAVAVLPDERGSLVAWDLQHATSRRLGRYPAQDARGPGVTNVLAPDGALLAQADEHGEVHVVDVATGTMRSMGQLDDKAFALAFSTDGRQLVAGTRAGEVRLWDLHAGTNRTLLRIRAILWAVALSPDGKRVAAASNDGIVHVVDVASGRETRLAGHVGAVGSVDFLPDGRLLSSGTDGTVRLWEVDRNQGVIVRRDPSTVWYAGASADGSLILSSAGTTTSIWEASSLPPTVADVSAFREWAWSKTTAEVAEITGRPGSASSPL